MMKNIFEGFSRDFRYRFFFLHARGNSFVLRIGKFSLMWSTTSLRSKMSNPMKTRLRIKLYKTPSHPMNLQPSFNLIQQRNFLTVNILKINWKGIFTVFTSSKTVDSIRYLVYLITLQTWYRNPPFLSFSILLFGRKK